MDGPESPRVPHSSNLSPVKGDELADTLHKLSLTTPTDNGPFTTKNEFGSPVALQASSAGRLSRKSSSTSLRRTSTNTAATDKPLSSPKLNRKSSAASLNAGDGQTTPKKPPFRRSSSSNQHLSPRSPSSNQVFNSQLVEKPPQTAASVASSHFTKELALHEDTQNLSSDTIVIVHDSCYGHRFSRPRTSKVNLSLIVERPERLQAGVLGLSSAYVRLGSRHADGEHAIHPHVEPNPQLPFRIKKTTRSLAITSPFVTNVHGTKWMQELKTMCDLVETRLSSGTKELTRPDTPNNGSSQAAKPRLHEGDLYLCGESLNAFQGALGGVLDGVDAVFGGDAGSGSHSKAFVCVRPPGHHCSADMPSGFCWLNNVHVGIEYAAQTYGLTHAAIIDFDLHHGDGSQTITWDRNTKALKQPKNAPLSKKTMIGYFSLHDINSYPCEWGEIDKVQAASLCIENAHGQSVWNVHLQPWKTEEDFWSLYRERYSLLLDKARSFLRLQNERIRSLPGNIQPKAAIFLSAGFDASEWEGQGMQRHKVNVPTEFYARFTADVVKIAEEEASACNGRVISVLEGGYSDRALMSGVLSHLTGLTTHSAKSTPNQGLGYDLSSTVNGTEPRDATFDKKWWSAESLAELESVMNPGAIPAPPKKTRTQELSNFASPTQSFTAKAVDPSKLRSLSGNVKPAPVSRPPTPPPPDVDWATAAYELSKLLIPSDRQINSCRHEDLSEPRVKRERYSSMGVQPSEQQPAAPNNRQLRGRKAKEATQGASRPPSANANRTDRRRTMSDLSSIVDDSEPPPALPVPLAGAGPRPAAPEAEPHLNQQGASEAPNPVRPAAARFNSASEMKVPKTRRQSAGKVNFVQPEAPTGSSIASMPNNVVETSKEEAVENNSTNVDSLTTGVTKLTLKYTPPPAQASVEPKADAEKPASKPPRKAPAAKIPRAVAPKTTGSKASKSKLPTASKSTGTASTENSSIEAQASLRLETGVSEVPPIKMTSDYDSMPVDIREPDPLPQLVSSDPVTSTASERTSSVVTPEVPGRPDGNGTAPVEPADIFIPYQPQQSDSGNFEHTTAATNHPLTWLPPNTSTPTQTPVKRTKDDLPVFTAQSFIPFATDSRPASKGSTADSRPATSSGGSGVLSVDAGTENQHPTGKPSSLWDIPDTPSRN